MNWDRIARRQGGIVAHRQLCAAGMTRDEVSGLVVRGALVPTRYRGVYRPVGAPRSAEAEAWLAVLGSKAVLSYVSAAQWWELPVESDGRIHITRHARQRCRPHPQVRIHRTLLLPGAVTDRFGLPITTRRETLLDCLGWLPRSPARTLLDRSFQQSWIGPADIQRRLDDEGGRWGNRQLTDLLRESRPGAEAESERRLQKLLLQAGITGWHGNLTVVVAGQRFRLDIAFVEQRLDVEVDGWAFHRSKERRDRDMARANALTAAGWRVLTFSWENVRDRPDEVIAAIVSVLAQATSF